MRRANWLLLRLAAAHAAAVALPVLAGSLGPGDIAIVAFNSVSNDDDLAWVSLRDIPANTSIRFTDSSVSNGHFRWSEDLAAIQGGPLIWTHAAVVTAGTVVAFTGTTTNWSIGSASNNVPELSNDGGDQIFAYTGEIVYDTSLPSDWRGNPAAAVMLCGLNFGNSGWAGSGLGLSTSDVPAGLSEAEYTAPHVTDKNNGFYSGPTTGTVSRLRAAIADPANWQTSDQYISPGSWPASFCVLPDAPILEFASIPRYERSLALLSLPFPHVPVPVSHEGPR
jgi:hypothetical protein